MARKRMIAPCMWEDEKFNKLDIAGRLIFIGLITLADDEGRMKGHPAVIRGKMFPFGNITEKKVKNELEVIDKLGMINYWQDKENHYIQIINFHKYQIQRGDRIQKSIIPSMPNKSSVNTYDALKIIKNGTEPLRIVITKRDKMCRYCGKPFPQGSLNWVLEHIIPESKGGKTNEDNCVLACASCNSKKSNKTPKEVGMKLLPLCQNAADCGETPQVAAEEKRREEKRREVKRRKEKGLLREKQNLPSFNFFIDKWNEKLEPKIELLSKSRKEKLRVRIKEKNFTDNYEKILGLIKTTPFLQGSNDRGWIADFDWLIANDTNYLKVLEGKYKNKSKGGLL